MFFLGIVISAYFLSETKPQPNAVVTYEIRLF